MPKFDARGRQVPVHYMRPNESVWTPPSVIFFDTETSWSQVGTTELHRLRLWTAVHVDRRRNNRKLEPPTWGWGETAADLAGWVNGRCVGRETVWMFAHNLAFDLTVTDLPAVMVAAGWTVKSFSTGGGAPFLRFGKGKKTLTVCDSWSWLPERLDSIAARMGRHKAPLPENLAGTDEWFRRCALDVDLTARAVLDLMAWWDVQRLGRWTISGAGCGYNAMRHIPDRHKIVIDPEPELVAHDRLAVRGGRKDAAVIRSLTGGPWVELDLVAAYPTTAKELPLPLKRVGGFRSLDIGDHRIRNKFLGPVASVTIRTDHPRYPVRHAGVTWYPVGEFRTVLAGPEIRWAADNGDLVSIGPGQFHRLGYALRSWATWVLDPTRGATVEVPPVGLIAAKSWGRSALGKWAARSSTTEALEGPAPPGWANQRVRDMRTGRRGAEVRMGGRAWLVTNDGDTDECYPAIYAWVESEVRVRLGKVLDALDGNWWAADTDGVIIDLEHWPRWHRTGTVRLGPRPRDPMGAAEALCSALAPLVAPLTIRPKRTFDSLRVLGPQHLIAGDTRRMAGVATGAVETEPWRFESRDWPKMEWQLRNSTPGTFTRPTRVSTFRAPTVHRWVMADGSTRPVEFRLSAGGGNELVPFGRSRWAGDEVGMAPLQYHKLTGVQ